MPKTRLVRTKCCICQKDQTRPFLKVQGFNLVQCRECGLVYVNPRYSQSRLSQYYNHEYFTGIGEKQFHEKYKTSVFEPIVDELIQVTGLHRGQLLDVGTAAGWLLKVAQKQGFAVQGIEPSVTAAKFAREKIGLPVKTGTLLTAKLPPRSFDVTTLIGVTEHLTNPPKNLKKAHELLKPGGWIVVFVPNIASSGFKIFQEGYAFINPQVHLWYFSPQTITQLFKKSGFTVKKITYPFFKTPYFNPKELARLAINLTRKLILTPDQTIPSAAWHGNTMCLYAVKPQSSKIKIKKEYHPSPTEQQVASLYAPLWEDYDSELFDQSVELFGRRLRANGFNLNWFRGKTCLDAGCGGGRYLVALNRLKAKRVVGLDMNLRGLKDAAKWISQYRLKKITLRHGSVLDIPYRANSFDFVCCNGVLHHTEDPDQGLSELVRVLKPGGKLFVYVYGRGGLYWTFIDLLRFIGKFIPLDLVDKSMKLVSLPPNSRFHWLDLMYVPIQERYLAKQVVPWFKRQGLIKVQLLEKERYYHESPWQKFLYGEGDLRFLASKPR